MTDKMTLEEAIDELTLKSSLSRSRIKELLEAYFSAIIRQKTGVSPAETIMMPRSVWEILHPDTNQPPTWQTGLTIHHTD